MAVLSYPVWETPSGNLGKIEALNTYNFNFIASDPLGGPITYKHVSGDLPAGLQVDESGYLNGVPLDHYLIDGVPESTTQDVVSNFTIRATTSSGGITDRNFTITVTGNYPPQLLTSNYQPLGIFYDGVEVNIQLSAVDLNNDALTFKVASGEFPPGLTLSNSGLISGILLPNYSGNYGKAAGWANSQWDEYPWQFSPYSTNYVYNFIIQVTDGKSIISQNYSIAVYAKNDIRADNGYLTSDTTLVTSDTTSDRLPILITQQSDLGDYANFVSGNYFAFKFSGIDLDGVPVGFAIGGGSGDHGGWDNEYNGWDSQPYDQSTYALPLGLNLDANTGWLTGYVPEQSIALKTYKFAIYAYNQYNRSLYTKPRLFTINILSALDLRVNWLTNPDLGYIENGSISQLQIVAQAPSGRPLYYVLESGSKLPQGLVLQQDGLISGRVTFQAFSLDGSANIRTTFDVNNYGLGKVAAPTTFDSTYKFTVMASDYSGSVSGLQTFTLKTKSVTYSSYDNLYVVCKPPLAKRELLNSILSDTDYFTYDYLYRPSDPWWGVQSEIKLLVGYGLTPAQASTYILAMQERHYGKKFFFGDYNYAIATDDSGNTIYEVVYINLVEDTAAYNNVSGQLVKTIPDNTVKSNLTFRITTTYDNKITTFDLAKTNFVQLSNELYTNDLTLMYNTLVDNVGNTNSNTLPRWQTSIQPNGKTLGFQSAVVLAYLKPGLGEKVLFKLRNKRPADIKLIPFFADRYVLDNNLDANFNLTTQKWLTKAYTTFDTGYIQTINPTAIVDFAVDLPFNQIDQQTVIKMNKLGGLDGSVGDYNNKYIIFATQENYIGYGSLANNGWIKKNEVIPGFAEVSNGSSSVNQRAGIWKITVKYSQLTLTFVQEIQINQVVAIRFGNRGGKKMQYTPDYVGTLNYTVPSYFIANTDSVQIKVPTTFDSSTTRFVNNTDQYSNPLDNSTYLKFPRKDVLDLIEVSLNVNK